MPRSAVSGSPSPTPATETLGAGWSVEESRIRSAYGRRADRGWYSWFNQAHLLGMQEIERALVAALVRHGRSSLDNVTVLDVGCGTGAWLREFIKLGARPERLSGVDLVVERIAEARQLCPAGVTLQCGNAAALDFQSGTFDLVWQSMLFTSVLDSRHAAIDRGGNAAGDQT